MRNKKREVALSACLLGCACRYDAKAQVALDLGIESWDAEEYLLNHTF